MTKTATLLCAFAWLTAGGASAQAPTLAVDDVSVAEGGGGATSAIFTVRLSSGSAAPAPMPVISRGVPVYASASQNDPAYANDDSYDTEWRSTGDMPVWIAYDLSNVPAVQRGQVVVMWMGDGANGYWAEIGGGDRYNLPGIYTIDAHAAPGGGQPPAAGDAGWVTLASVTDLNLYNARQHVVSLTNGGTVYNWLRMRVTQVNGTIWNWDVSLNLDVHDAHLGVQDDWLFLGDSITDGAMRHQEGGDGDLNFSQIVHQAHPDTFPAAQGGGIGGWSSWNALDVIDAWLDKFPGRYVGIAFGTNDAGWLGGSEADQQYFYECYESLVQSVLARGKIPVIPTIPWLRTPAVERVPLLNAKLAQLKQAYPQILDGPDLWTFFLEHQELISDDDIHPTLEGFFAYRRLWAEKMLSSVYE